MKSPKRFYLNERVFIYLFIIYFLFIYFFIYLLICLFIYLFISFWKSPLEEYMEAFALSTSCLTKRAGEILNVSFVIVSFTVMRVLHKYIVDARTHIFH